MKVDRAKFKFYLLIFLIVGIVVVSLILHAKGYHLNLYKYAQQLRSEKLFPLIYILLFIVSCFFPIPFLTFLGALVFPFYLAVILSIIGNIISFTIMFYLTR